MKLTKQRSVLIKFIKGNIIKEENIKKHIKSFIFISYRFGFPLCHNLDSDIGWGCTIRSSQMMMASILQNIYNKKDLINKFIDNDKNCYSIHNFVDYGKVIMDIKPGNWFGPNNCCHCISQFIKNEEQDINVYITDSFNRTIYMDEIGDLFNKKLLLLIPMRLGLNNIQENYINDLIKMFDIENFYGIIGGKSNSSYYFIGYNDNYLYALDPHFVNRYDDRDKYNTDTPIKVNINELCPTMALGFLFNNKNEYYDMLNKYIHTNFNLFYFASTREKIDDKKQTIEDWEML